MTYTAITTNDRWQGMNWLRQEKRIALLLRDDCQCVYCGCDLRDAGPRQRQIDHLFPRSRGGDNSTENLATACEGCNLAKGDMTLAEFADYTGDIEMVERVLATTARPLKPLMARAKALLTLKKTMKKAA